MEDFALDVSMLKSLLENNTSIPNNAKVCIQRIKDIYFDKHGWEPIMIPDHIYPVGSEYSIDDEFVLAYSAEYNREKNVLLIYGHY